MISVYRLVHINDPLLLIGKNSPRSGGSGFPLSSLWSKTSCPTSYNRKYNLMSILLNQTFPSFKKNLQYKLSENF